MKDSKPDKQQVNTGNKWKKGQSGNPKGRPKGTATVAGELRRLLAQKAPDCVKMTKLEKILKNVVNNAMEGDKWSIQLLIERTEGKALERIQSIADEFYDDGL